MIDDDPIFARVRAARPAPPASLTAAVLERLPVRRRPVLPLAMAGAVAILAGVVIIGLRRDEGDSTVPSIVEVAPQPSPAGGGADAATEPPPAPARPDWTDLRGLLIDLHATHGDALRGCMIRGRTRVELQVIRTGTADGRQVVAYGFRVGGGAIEEEETCIEDVVKTIALPRLPSSISQIKFALMLAPGAMSKAPLYGAWNDPASEAEATFAAHDAELRGCLTAGISSADLPAGMWTSVTDRPKTRKAHVYVDGVRTCDGRGCGDSKPPYDPACMARVGRAIAAPHLPWPIIQVDAIHRVTAEP